MALILARSPFFVTNQGFDEGATLTLELGYKQYVPPVTIEFIVEDSYVLNFRKQTEIDISPLIRGELVDNNVRRVRVSVSGEIGGVPQSTVTNEYVSSDGYLFYTDGYNTDKESDLISNSFYTGSCDTVYKLDDERMSIFLFMSSDTEYKADVRFISNGNTVKTVNNISFGESGLGVFNASERIVEVSDSDSINFEDRVSDDSGTLEGSLCLDRFFRNYETYHVDEIEIDSYITSGVILNTKKIKVENIEECKYTPRKVEFRNRWGVPEQFWFFKRSDKTLDITRERFRSSTIDTFKTGDLSKHIYKDYNVNAKESITMNTGWIPESFYETLTQMAMSEFAWMYVDGVKLPINIKSSSLNEKLHINEKLINYEIEVEFSFDKIGSVI